MPQPDRQTTCKSRRQHLYHDPTRFTCRNCKSIFRSSLSLKRHCAQLHACQSSSEDEEPTQPPSVASRTPLGAAGDTIPFVQDQLGTPSESIKANTNLEDGAGSDEHPVGVGGDTGEDAWVEDIDMAGDGSFAASGVSNMSGAYATVPSEPPMKSCTIEDVYIGAGKVIGHSKTPYEHISMLPRYQDIKSKEQLDQACYPFSNPDEIEIVDWIFSSQLSHASINKFLQMNYVSSGHYGSTTLLTPLSTDYRLRMPLSLLPLPKHWTSISTNSPELDHLGRVPQYPQLLAFPRRTPLPSCIIVTQLRSFSTSCLTQHCRREFHGPHAGFTKMKRRQTAYYLIYPLVTGGGMSK